MSIVLLSAGLLAVLLGLAFFALFRRMLGRQAAVVSAPVAFSIQSYRPMERLLSREDCDFLKSQPGAGPAIARRMRAMHRRIFRRYLDALSRDFDAIYTAANLALLACPDDRPDLAAALLKQRLLYRYGVAVLRCRLLLEPLGLTVDARGLLEGVEWLYAQFQLCLPRQQTSIADAFWASLAETRG